MKRALLLVFVGLVLAACQTTSARTINKLSAQSSEKVILVMPTDVELSELHASGLTTPHAEWTDNARKHIDDALRKELTAHNARLIDYTKSTDDEKRTSTKVQLQKLHGVVGGTIFVNHFNPNGKLPAKKEKFDWTLGPQAKVLKQQHNADYALFVYVRDSYATASRVAAQVIGALLGVGIQGGVQFGFCSLVDLNSGDIVWFNYLARGHGDLRTPEPAMESVKELLLNFPT